MDYKRILVISDLHMTSGKNPHTGVWAATEDFFWDKEFYDFIEFYKNGSPSLLIINGDLLDFLQVLVFPTDEEKKLYSISNEEINRTYGLRCTENASVFQVDKIFEGHREFFEALALFISHGNYVKILKGNHDIQLYWQKVQERIIQNLEELTDGENKKLIRTNLEFLPWFYYIPGKLYVEHGNQYEYTTSFRNFLYPFLPFDYEGVSSQIELDLSSFLVRYFSNRMEPVNPLSDNIRPLSKYLDEFWKNYPYIFITSIGTASRYVLKAFSKARAASKMKKKSDAVDKKNNELIKLEAERYFPDNIGQREWFEKNLYKINSLKEEPVLSSGAFSFLWSMVKTPLKGLLWALPLYIFFILSDFLRPLAEKLDESTWKDVLLFLFKIKFPEILLALLITISLISLRTWLRKKRAKKEKPEPDEIRIKIRKSAQKIAEYLDVGVVVFGHTHYADIHKISDNAFYFNTGTWMGIFAPEEELYRDAKQFTFFLIEGDEEKLLHWNIDRSRPQPVIVVDTEIPLTEEEDSFIKIFFSFFKRNT